MNRRKFMGFGMFIPILAAPGCITSRVYSDANSRLAYFEEIKGILISSDKKNFVVVGSIYHYIFEAPTTVLAALDPSLHPVIDAAEFRSFKVDNQNKIQGQLILQTKPNASATERSLARQSGFLDHGSKMKAEIELHGERYRSNNEASLPLQELHKKYSVYIKEEPTKALTALKVAATPITLAADGVMFIGSIVLLPIALPLFLSQACITCK